MAGSISRLNRSTTARRVTHDPAWVRWTLTIIALGFLGLFLFVPLAAVFAEALRRGFGPYFEAFRNPDAMAAIRLTLTVAIIAVPLNLVFGVVASWAIAKFQFPGKSLLITLIDLPFAVSPVISGLIFVLCSVCRDGSGRGFTTTTSRSSSRCRGSCWPRFL